MWRRVREPFGKAGLIVAVVALVAAMVGGAYAASGLNSTQKKEVKKIAKKYAGAPGAPGAPGANGVNGAAGAKGDKGEKGDTGPKGDKGEKGDTGQAGKSPTVVQIGTPPSPECAGVGGVKVTDAGGTAAFACNGKDGTGGEGEYPKQLPEGRTATGTWQLSRMALVEGEEEFGRTVTSVSYPLPVVPTPTEALLISNTSSEAEKEKCEGSIAEPKADPGVLCLYIAINLVEPVRPPVFQEMFPFGALVLFENLDAAAAGTWAVTAG